MRGFGCVGGTRQFRGGMCISRLRDAFHSKDSAKENWRVFYLLMLLFCGTN